MYPIFLSICMVTFWSTRLSSSKRIRKRDGWPNIRCVSGCWEIVLELSGFLVMAVAMIVSSAAGLNVRCTPKNISYKHFIEIIY